MCNPKRQKRVGCSGQILACTNVQCHARLVMCIPECIHAGCIMSEQGCGSGMLWWECWGHRAQRTGCAGECGCVSACSPHLLTFENVFLNPCGAGFAVRKHCLGWAVGIQIINQTLIILPTKPSTARLDNTNVEKEMGMNHVQYLKPRMHCAVRTKPNTVFMWVLRHSRARPSAGAGKCSVDASKDALPTVRSRAVLFIPSISR